MWANGTGFCKHWSHPSLNTFYKTIPFCLPESYLPLYHLITWLHWNISYSAFEYPLYYQSFESECSFAYSKSFIWLLSCYLSGKTLVHMNFTILGSFVLMLFPWKIHIDVLLIRNGLISLHCLIYDDNPIINTGFTIPVKKKWGFFLSVWNNFSWKNIFCEYSG